MAFAAIGSDPPEDLDFEDTNFFRNSNPATIVVVAPGPGENPYHTLGEDMVCVQGANPWQLTSLSGEKNIWEKILYAAAEARRMCIVESALKMGAVRLNDAMEVAVTRGNNEIVKVLVESGAANWSRGIEAAIIARNREAIVFFKQRCVVKKSSIDCARRMWESSPPEEKDARWEIYQLLGGK